MKTRPSNGSSPPEESTGRKGLAGWIQVLGPVVFLVVMHFRFGMASPADGWLGFRYWSGSGLRFLPVPIVASIGALAIAAAVLVLLRSRRTFPTEAGARKNRIFMVSTLLTAVGLALTFQVRYGYLGDNWLRVREAAEGLGNDNERGAIAFFHELAARTGDLSLEHVAETFRVVGLVAGMVYVLLFIVAGSVLRLSLDEKKAMTFLALLSGVFLFFCGYLELYGLVLPLIVAVVTLSFYGVREPRWAWAGLVLALAASFVHKLTLLWIPAAIVPILLTIPRPGTWSSQSVARPGSESKPQLQQAEPQREPERESQSEAAQGPRLGEGFANISGRTLLAVTGGLLALGFGAAAWLSRSTTLLLRWAPHENRPYAVFGPQHLSDFWNAQWVGSAGGLVLGIAGLFWLVGRRRAGAMTWVGLWSWILPAGALFVFNPVLGGADWDVLALASPFALLFAYSIGFEERSGGHSANPLVDQHGDPPENRSDLSADGRREAAVFAPRRTLWPVALGVSLAVTLPWFLLHRSEASTDWFGELIRHDIADYYQTHPPNLHLAFVYAANGRTEARREALERGLQESPDDPRIPLALARIAIENDDWDRAEARAMEAYGIVRGYLPAMDVLYEVFRRKGRTEDQVGAGTVILKAHEEEPDQVERFLPPERIEEIRRDLEAAGKDDEATRSDAPSSGPD